LFEAPTVAGLAMVITQRQAQEADPQEWASILAKLEDLSEGRF
jgi:hypothetical protein